MPSASLPYRGFANGVSWLVSRDVSRPLGTTKIERIDMNFTEILKEMARAAICGIMSMFLFTQYQSESLFESIIVLVCGTLFAMFFTIYSVAMGVSYYNKRNKKDED